MVPESVVQQIPFFSSEDPPVVIVGNGPVGRRVAAELRHHQPDLPVLVFGDEPHEAYSREQLSSWLAGALDSDDLMRSRMGRLPEGVEQRLGCRIVALDPDKRTLTDSRGVVWPYRRVVLATGSSPHVPGVPGMQLPGVYRFHDLDDATRLLARRARSHHTVVLGAGPLGLEVARGMQRMGTQVTVIDHADRLLPMQLDVHASAFLQYELCCKGIAVLLGSGIEKVLGRERVNGVRLRDGTELPCDTLVLAAGIRPHTELARAAGISCRRGIRVDDHMRTSVPDIYAIGDCAEHDDRIYGLLAPGLEQAEVAAANICGAPARYKGSTPANILKVLGMPVFSVGSMGIDARRHSGRSYCFSKPEKDHYRRILVNRHRLVGVVGVGEWDEAVRVQAHIQKRGWVMPWQVMRFLRSGRLWAKTR